jgi:hypothetical protein
MKKKRLNEKMGGGGRIGLGGMNSTGPFNTRHMTKYPSGYHTGGYQGNADSQISQRHGLASTLEEENEDLEYKEDQNMLEEEEEDLMEFFARIMKMPLTESEKEEIISDISLEKEDEEDIDEMSAGGVAGVAVPLGKNPDGSKTTRSQLDKLRTNQRDKSWYIPKKNK